MGIGFENTRFISLIIDTLNRKKGFTHESRAWNQYDHLAEWLIEVGSVIDIRGTLLESAYNELVSYSFTNMSKAKSVGYSWDAYKTWDGRFRELRLENQKLIKHLVTEKFPKGHDAYEVIS